MRENREIPPLTGEKINAGPSGEGQPPKPGMHGGGKSDSPVVPAKPPNKAVAAEAVEGRGLTKGNARRDASAEHRVGTCLSQAQDRIRKAA